MLWGKSTRTTRWKPKDELEEDQRKWPAQDHSLKAKASRKAHAMPAESAMAQRSSAQVRDSGRGHPCTLCASEPKPSQWDHGKPWVMTMLALFLATRFASISDLPQRHVKQLKKLVRRCCQLLLRKMWTTSLNFHFTAFDLDCTSNTIRTLCNCLLKVSLFPQLYLEVV